MILVFSPLSEHFPASFLFKVYDFFLFLKILHRLLLLLRRSINFRTVYIMLCFVTHTFTLFSKAVYSLYISQLIRFDKVFKRSRRHFFIILIYNFNFRFLLYTRTLFSMFLGFYILHRFHCFSLSLYL